MTRVFGILGFPIGHSLSPVMHNAAFQALGLDAIYAPFDVAPGHLRRVLQGLMVAGIDGLNVTVPLKEAVVPYVDALHGAARQLRAVNTIVVRQGRGIGYNTDVTGFTRALEELGWKSRPCSAVVIGAGGAAKAVAWALTQHPGTTLTVANRHLARARQLVRWLKRHRPRCVIRAKGLGHLRLDGEDVLVNATPCGMRARDPSLIDLRGCHRRLVVYDLVYTRVTPLVRAARQCGCVAANGVSMLVYQGAAAFELWYRRKPPVRLMRQAVEQALRGR